MEENKDLIELCKAARREDVGFLDKNIDILSVDNIKEHLLNEAANFNSIKVVDFLLTIGAEISFKNYLSLGLAVEQGYREIIVKLLQTCNILDLRENCFFWNDISYTEGMLKDFDFFIEQYRVALENKQFDMYIQSGSVKIKDKPVYNKMIYIFRNLYVSNYDKLECCLNLMNLPRVVKENHIQKMNNGNQDEVINMVENWVESNISHELSKKIIRSEILLMKSRQIRDRNPKYESPFKNFF